MIYQRGTYGQRFSKWSGLSRSRLDLKPSFSFPQESGGLLSNTLLGTRSLTKTLTKASHAQPSSHHSRLMDESSDFESWLAVL